MSSSPSPFTINVNAVGGGGGGGGSKSRFGIGSLRSKQSNDQDTGIGTGKANPGQSRIRRESMNINNIESEFSLETGFITVIPAPRLPRRVVLTAECYHGGRAPNNTFAFAVDVLLVPTSFNMETCFHLYLGPRKNGYEGMRRLRDNIVLLRRIAAHGMDMGVAAEQCDIPEDIQNRTDYRLVVTCPVLYFTSPFVEPAQEEFAEEEPAEPQPFDDGFFILLEMEFDA